MSGKPFKPNDDDVFLGHQIAAWRNKLGLSQKDLAKVLGVTFQQVQKYETAGNRVAASRLWQIARAMDLPVATLYNEEYRPPKVDKALAEAIVMLTRMSKKRRDYLLWLMKTVAEYPNLQMTNLIN